MLLDLGCTVEVLGFSVRNTHNSVSNDYSTKRLRVEVTAWSTGSDSVVLAEDLPSSLDKVENILNAKKLSPDPPAMLCPPGGV